jgi:hypothetical protein
VYDVTALVLPSNVRLYKPIALHTYAEFALEASCQKKILPGQNQHTTCNCGDLDCSTVLKPRIMSCLVCVHDNKYGEINEKFHISSKKNWNCWSKLHNEPNDRAVSKTNEWMTRMTTLRDEFAWKITKRICMNYELWTIGILGKIRRRRSVNFGTQFPSHNTYVRM